jgi:S-disulfanyl-L-cysteine oxidoreductase SoxD
MKTPIVAIALSAVLAVVIATTIRFDPSANDQAEAMLRPDDPKVLAKGERIYAEHCASCHGDRLQGQPDWRTRGADGLLPAPPHDADGHTWHHPDEMLFRITKFGVASIVGDPGYKTSMPAYDGRLSDDEIIAVLSWIKAQWPAQVRQKHDQINAQAAKAARR